MATTGNVSIHLISVHSKWIKFHLAWLYRFMAQVLWWHCLSVFTYSWYLNVSHLVIENGNVSSLTFSDQLNIKQSICDSITPMKITLNEITLKNRFSHEIWSLLHMDFCWADIQIFSLVSISNLLTQKQKEFWCYISILKEAWNWWLKVCRNNLFLNHFILLTMND